MLQAATGCGCNDDDGCVTLPAEFVRVRYYYGQRLGVMELNDQGAYHRGKLAFHQARLHGAGVLCGLRAERFATAQNVPGSTVLRVSRGAAVDACGREIVVGVDQCIDVAAWFARNRSRPELAGWTAGTTQHLHVCLRYAECPSDPAPAPRDPCGCGSGSCEYGRVREGFSLTLLTDEEKAASCTDASFPETPALLAALAGTGPVGSAGADAAALERRLAGLVAAGCPDPQDAPCLCLASFDATLDDTPVPVNITDPDNAIPERRTLLPSGALQALVLAAALEAADAGSFGAGPRVGPMTFTPNGADAGTLELPVQLAPAGDPPQDASLVPSTFDPADVSVRVLRPNTSSGWEDPATAPTITLEDHPPRFVLAFAGGLEKDVPYRIAFDADPGAPIADSAGRPLRPQRLARTFTFVEDAGALRLGSLR